MSKLRSIAIILGVILVMLPVAVRAQATLTAMKLLTRNTGWALMHGRLYWTTDFGQDWRKITPPLNPPGTEIASVFFLNTSTGWALLRTPHSTAEKVVFGDWGFELASTGNAGASWSVTPVQLPHLPAWENLGGGGSVDFVDAAHGWMDLSLVGLTDRGLLFSTRDGGGTWQRVTSAPPIAASLKFVTRKDGWLAGGPSSSDLYVTHDGGATWNKLEFKPPSQLGRVTVTSYSVPVFANPVRAAVVVSYPVNDAVALFATKDAGRSWTLVSALPNLPLNGGNAATVLDSELLVARTTGGGELVLKLVGPRNKMRKFSAPIRLKEGTASQLSFMDDQTGWALAGGRLFATTDGGASWADATPRHSSAHGSALPPALATEGLASGYPNGKPNSLRDPSLNAALTTAGPTKAVGTEHISVHLGFDSATAPPPPTMQTWWTYSPYYDYGFYLGGKDTTHALSGQYPNSQYPISAATWVSDAVGYGWGLIPFWVGPQAPCSSGHTSYIDATSASTETGNGSTEATAAYNKAQDLYLTSANTIIYYDMEQYNQTDAACQQAVTNFIEGWVTELHSMGYKAGLYTATADAEADWNALPASDRPDDIMVGKYDTRATIWGLHCGKNGCAESYGLTDDTWTEDQRIHQYYNYPQNASGGESYGNVALYCASNCIDRDIEYAQVDGGNLTKSYAYGSGPSVQPGNSVGALNDDGMGNDGPLQAVGYCNIGAGGEAFLWSADPSSITSLCFVPASGAEDTSAQGINNEGNAFQGPEVVGFFYPNGSYGPEGFKGTVSAISAGQSPSLFTLPGEPFNELDGINDDDQMAGVYETGVNCPLLGFVYDTNSGNYKTFTFSNLVGSVYIAGINGFGQVAGWYQDSKGLHGFIYDWSQGTVTQTINVSSCVSKGSSGTEVWGINNNELVSGACRSTGTPFLYDFAHQTVVGQPPFSSGIDDKGDVAGESGGIATPTQQ